MIEIFFIYSSFGYSVLFFINAVPGYDVTNKDVAAKIAFKVLMRMRMGMKWNIVHSLLVVD